MAGPFFSHFYFSFVESSKVPKVILNICKKFIVLHSQKLVISFYPQAFPLPNIFSLVNHQNLCHSFPLKYEEKLF